MWVGVSEGGAPSIYWPLQSLPSLPCPPHHTYIPCLNNHTMPHHIVTYTSIPPHPTVQYFALLKRSEACLSLHQILNWEHQHYEDTTDWRKSRKRKSESDHIAKRVRENRSDMKANTTGMLESQCKKKRSIKKVEAADRKQLRKWKWRKHHKAKGAREDRALTSWNWGEVREHRRENL